MPRVTPAKIELLDEGALFIARHASEAEKLRLLANLYRNQLDRIRFTIGREHPEWSAQQQRREIARRISGNDPAVLAAVDGGENGAE